MQKSKTHRSHLIITLSISLTAIILPGCKSSSTSTGRDSAASPTTRVSAYDKPASSPDVTYARDSVTYLASNYLEGRLPGTEGERLASEFIANEFRHAGLVPVPGRSDYFQPFMHTVGRRVEKADIAIAGTPLQPDKDYTALSLSGSGTLQGEVVFVGYGVSDPENTLIPGGYDDYAGLDVKGKIVVVMRYEPQSSKEKSRLTEDGTNSRRASLTTKLSTAVARGAKAVLFVNPPNTHDGNELLSFNMSGGGRGGTVPVAMITAAVADRLLTAGGAEPLAQLQKQIDESVKPASVALTTPVSIDFKLVNDRKPIRNVIGVLEGTGPRKDEYIVVGAHFDHLGRGGSGSLLRGSREIHNGADDNASGTTAMLLVAKRVGDLKRSNPQLFDRSILFAAFTAEEQGLIGSQYMVDHPPVPLQSMTYMLNLDMVGRVKENLLFVGGSGTSELFDAMLAEADEASPLTFRNMGRGGRGPSDHQSFGLKKIPVLFFFSGLHPEYHRPADDSWLINYDGLVQAADVAQRILLQLVNAPRTDYIAKYDTEGVRLGSSGTFRVTLGVVPDYADEGIKGVRISGTTPGTAAALAGLQGGDVITKLDDKAIESVEALTEFLASARPGQKVNVTYVRSGAPQTVEVTLTERR